MNESIPALNRAVRAIRERIGESPTEMAGKLGVSRPELAYVELGRRPVDNDLIHRFSEAYGIDLHTADWCLFGDESKLPEPLRGSALDLRLEWTRRLEEVIGGPLEPECD